MSHCVSNCPGAVTCNKMSINVTNFFNAPNSTCIFCLGALCGFDLSTLIHLRVNCKYMPGLQGMMTKRM